MGCFGSREDSRRKVFDEDWSTNDYAFGPAEVKDLKAFCPLDLIVVKWLADKKELAEKLGELPLTEDKAKELGGEVWASMKEFHAIIAKTKEGTTKDEVFG
jgi:hypothetical protein